MDEELRRLLAEIRDLQLEQLELLKKIRSGVPPWLTWRFRVHHLLILVTIVAVVLGLLVLEHR
jgi:hypothetical protein